MKRRGRSIPPLAFFSDIPLRTCVCVFVFLCPTYCRSCSFSCRSTEGTCVLTDRQPSVWTAANRRSCQLPVQFSWDAEWILFAEKIERVQNMIAHDITHSVAVASFNYRLVDARRNRHTDTHSMSEYTRNGEGRRRLVRGRKKAHEEMRRNSFQWF